MVRLCTEVPMRKSSPQHLDWQRLPGHRHLKGRAGHTATLVTKDIFVLGGRNGNVFFNDMWLFDTQIEQWKLLQAKAPFSPRAYHTCTLVRNRELWIIGGSDPYTMYSDVHVYDTVSSEWSSPVLSGPSAMKPRGTHAAVLHPLKEHCILIYGGYGRAESSSWMNDLILLHTETRQWEELNAGGIRPSPRGYHTLTVYGKLAVLFGGKGEGGIVKDDRLSIYKADTNEWISPFVEGDLPSPRSNHASTYLDTGKIIFHGGRHGSLRLSDTYVLQVLLIHPTDFSQGINVRCNAIERSKLGTIQRKPSRSTPSGRSAHTIIAKGQSVYVFGGYGGEGVTYNDIFVLRKLPNLPDVEITKRPLNDPCDTHMLMDNTSTTQEGDGGGSDAGESTLGWRTTKRAKLGKGSCRDGMPSSVEAKNPSKRNEISTKAKVLFTASETKSTEPIVDAGRNQNIEIVNSSVLQEEQVKSLQKSMEMLTATIQKKAAFVDSSLKERSLQIEQEMQFLETKNFELQAAVAEMKKELAIQNKKVQNQEQEKKRYEKEIQDLHMELKNKKNFIDVEKMKRIELEKQLKELTKLFEEHKRSCSEVFVERDKYKSCIQTLEEEVEKQMDALRQLTSRYETEKAFFVKEIAEKKGAGDKLLTDLGAAREHSRSLEENISYLSKQIDQDAIKIDILQKEKEVLTCSNAVLASEQKQLIDAKEALEGTCHSLHSELEAARALVKQNEAEVTQLKESLGQAKEHASTLHDTLTKREEAWQLQKEELDKFRILVKESEEFEQAQARLFQSHAEKLQCARQSCPHQGAIS